MSEHYIDRRAVVTRHTIILERADPLTPLSVGNGAFAFTADVTGLQTFPDFHARGMALGTHAEWGWHSLPNPAGYRLEDALEDYIVDGRAVPYLSGLDASGDYLPASGWLRANPHRLHLGQLGLRIVKTGSVPLVIDDVAHPRQTLDLWAGLLDSRFTVEGQPVHVLTVCHPALDALAVRVTSPLLVEGCLALTLAFPYGATQWGNAADWTQPERHQTQAVIDNNRADFTRILDADGYHVRLVCSRAGRVQAITEHAYEIALAEGDTLDLVLAFTPEPLADPLPDFAATRAAAARHWTAFWESGGALDFSDCTDPRAVELERRVVLSQYLTAIQCAGSMPPQETGLTCNSWYGKAHLEMHWWHAAHFALWDRLPLLERSLPWYERILPLAQETAARQGYRGSRHRAARWPKMVGPDGQDSPSEVGIFLIWQQPHPIYLAELCYRAHPQRETLEQYRQVVFATAEFMASYPVWNGQRYVLGPALIPAQESYAADRARNLNPTFELAYWHWALDVAQRWRERLGLGRDPQWERVLRGLARPTVRDGVYTAIETPPYTVPTDHPSILAALGVLPQTPLIDPAVMQRTFDHVLRTWNWPTTWGWDYPMLAMTAARLGRPEQAVDALFLDSPKNRYLANGHNYQSARLPLYLPGNGGLLTAVAMMSAGWDAAPDRPTPGFPTNGAWAVHHEGLRRMP